MIDVIVLEPKASDNLTWNSRKSLTMEITTSHTHCFHYKRKERKGKIKTFAGSLHLEKQKGLLECDEAKHSC